MSQLHANGGAVATPPPAQPSPAAAAASPAAASPSPSPAASASPAAAAASVTKPAAQKRRKDPGLDFFSPHFDPLRALRTPGVRPPLDLPPLASLDECAALLHEHDAYADLLRSLDPSSAAAPLSTSAPTASSPSLLLSSLHEAMRALREAQPLPVDDQHTLDSTALFSPPLSSSSAAPSPPHSAAAVAAASQVLPAMPAAPPSVAVSPSAASPSPIGVASSAPLLPTPTSDSVAPPTAPSPAQLEWHGSRMSADQVRANRERAEKKAAENAALKEKQSHYLDRFTTAFPAPPPIATTRQKAKSELGPMSLLVSFHTRRLRVWVILRRSHGACALLHAYLFAFDKHWNLLLTDVDETRSEFEWRLAGRETVARLRQQGVTVHIPRESRTQIDAWQREEEEARTSGTVNAAASVVPSAPLLPLPSGLTPSPATSASTPRAPLIRVEVLKRRHLNQLYVRGDCVVTVCERQPTLFTLTQTNAAGEQSGRSRHQASSSSATATAETAAAAATRAATEAEARPPATALR